MKYTKKSTTFQDIHAIQAHQRGLKLQQYADALQAFTLGLSNTSLYPQSKLAWNRAKPKSGKSITFNDTTRIKIFSNTTNDTKLTTGKTDFGGKRLRFKVLHAFHIGLDTSIADLLR